MTRTTQGDTVMVVGADGKAAPRAWSSSGGDENGNWIVLDGLKPGEQVMVDGFQKMRAGAPVKPVPWSAERAGAAAAPAASAGRQPLIESRAMAQFFIERPIFAWVIALFILVLGGVAITQLPIAQYPPVAPPTIVITATYPGASAQTLDDAVISVIEQEMNGSPGMIYMESVSQANGTGTDHAQLRAGHQPRPRAGGRAEPPVARGAAPAGGRHAAGRARRQGALQLPAVHHPVVRQPGLRPDRAGRLRVAQRAARDCSACPGVGQAQLFGTERAMRIWIDPAKLVGFKLSTADVNAAIAGAERAGLRRARIGDLPNLPAQGDHRHGDRARAS